MLGQRRRRWPNINPTHVAYNCSPRMVKSSVQIKPNVSPPLHVAELHNLTLDIRINLRKSIGNNPCRSAWSGLGITAGYGPGSIRLLLGPCSVPALGGASNCKNNQPFSVDPDYSTGEDTRIDPRTWWICAVLSIRRTPRQRYTVC